MSPAPGADAARGAEPAGRRLTLLVTSPRVAPGLLSRDAWAAIDAASLVLAAASDEPLAQIVSGHGIPLSVLPVGTEVPAAARLLVDAAVAGDGPVL